MEHREIERVASSMMGVHGCHTAILYGSRARGDATSNSDVDLIFVREEGPSARDARLVDGIYMFTVSTTCDEKCLPDATASEGNK